MHEKIGVVSLGCTKNLVDTENMLGMLQSRGYVLTNDPAAADVIVVNTCGFIKEAKQESINTILEMAEYKKKGSLKGLIVTGCLSERYKQELVDELPEVDAFLGVSNGGDIVKAAEEVLAGNKYASFGKKAFQATADRVLTTPGYLAYVKIAEGCDNCCSYCAIPAIRGPLKSRPEADILAEARTLLDRGVKEIVLIAQDTTKYGMDLYGEPKLLPLAKAVADMKGLEWLRVLYSYPESITDELVDLFYEHEKICDYIDMPVQHLDDGLLKLMNRRSNYRTIADAVKRVRKKSGDFILRTSIITGFPDETEKAHEALKEGMQRLKFDRLGVFKYSREEGTKAAESPRQVPAPVKKRRFDELMELQAQISEERNAARIGKAYRMLIEGFDRSGGLYYGRSYAEAPEIDGEIFVQSKKNLTPGTFHDVVITEAYEYDLMGEPV
jgi:ribosomal protein S12 methylthiotransferase